MLPLFLAALLAAAVPARAQSVDVHLPEASSRSVAHVGDTLTVDVAVDLGSLHVSGVALYLTVPARGLALLPAADTRPLEPHLFADGVEFANHAVAPRDAFGVSEAASLLAYAVVLGPGADRFRSGPGILARVRLVCTEPAEAAAIGVFSNPIHTSMAVLDDGRTEVPLIAGDGLVVTVSEPSAKRAASTWGAVKALARP